MEEIGFVPLEIDTLETKQAMLAAIIASTDDTIISKTTKGMITSWNPAAERLFGYLEKEAIGQHISLIIPEDRLAEETFIISQILKGEKVDHFETVRRKKDGKLVPISLTISPIKDQSGRIIGASKIARDISAQKTAAEKQGVLAAIVDTSDDTIVSKTLDGIITSWNKAAVRMFGYTEAEAIGQHISLIIPPDRLDEETFIISEIRKGNKLAHFQTVRRTKSGEQIPISLSVSPVIDEGPMLCKEIKAIERLAHIPVIIFSTAMDIEQIAATCKANGYVHKPFDLDTLITEVRKFLPLDKIYAKT